MADKGLSEAGRRFRQTATYEDLSRYMRELDRTRTPYIQKVDFAGREGQWYETPIDSFEFGTSSPGRLTFLDAWTYAKDQGGLLQSLAEAMTRRVVFYKDNQARGTALDHTDTYQVTRTVNLKFYDNWGWYSAFTELPDEEASLELLTEGFESHSGDFQDLVRSRNDSFIARLLGQAKDSKRICPVQNDNKLVLSTKQNGSSAYGRHRNLVAVFGSQTIAELNAWYLQQRNHQKGHLWELTKGQVENKLKGKEKSVLVLPVGLGGVGYSYDAHVVVADIRFDVSDGLACAVV